MWAYNETVLSKWCDASHVGGMEFPFEVFEFWGVVYMENKNGFVG